MPNEELTDTKNRKKAYFKEIAIYTAINIVMVVLAVLFIFFFVDPEKRLLEYYVAVFNVPVFMGWALINSVILAFLPISRNTKFAGLKQNIPLAIILAVPITWETMAAHVKITWAVAPIAFAGIILEIMRIYIMFGALTSFFLWIIKRIFMKSK